MTAQEMWAAFSERNGITSPYEAWAYGDSPDMLAELTLQGIKTATASAYPVYELEREPLPEAGEYSVILNSRDEAVCVIKTTKVFTVPFCRVDERQAWKEGEGDRSLSYWREVHKKFFSSEMEELGLSFNEGMKVVCEEFIRVYP